MATFGRANKAVVIDMGAGYTKLGYAGNVDPTFVIPTCVANLARAGHNRRQEDKSYFVGEEAYRLKDSSQYLLSYPVSRGRIVNLDGFEKMMYDGIFDKLRSIPVDTNFMLTEPPLNQPEKREEVAEIMFELFNVKGLHIANQAVLSLYAHWAFNVQRPVDDSMQPELTGVVVDSGESQTTVVPVADGYVLTGGIREIPLAGKQVTQFINDRLAERGEPIPPEQRMETARLIKEQHTYICKDVVAEYAKYDAGARMFKTLTGVQSKTSQPWSIDIGYERFLAPEVFFAPELVGDSTSTPLPALIDKCITCCPVDCVRRLYSNVVLSGGSTTFQNFNQRLQKDLQRVVDARLAKIASTSGVQPRQMQVGVHSLRAAQQRNAAWLGGSLLSSKDSFQAMWKTKKEYREVGPSCMRGQGFCA